MSSQNTQSKESDDTTDQKAKAASENQRRVLIIRELPMDTKEGDVRNIFNSISGWKCPPIHTIRPDIGENWFISFNNEDDCLEAALKVQAEGSHNGNRVNCRVKSNLKANTKS